MRDDCAELHSSFYQVTVGKSMQAGMGGKDLELVRITFPLCVGFGLDEEPFDFWKEDVNTAVTMVSIDTLDTGCEYGATVKSIRF